MVKAVITGASGFIGSHLMDRLLRDGFEVVAIDLKPLGGKGGVTYECLDIADFQGCLQVLREHKDADVIYHLAAQVNVPLSFENPLEAFKINVTGTLNMLEAIRINGLKVRRFIYLSTAEVYGTPQRLPVDEEHPMLPRSPYGFTKALADRLVYGYYASYGIPVTIIRSWLVFGEGDAPTRAIPRFITQALRREPITVYGGDQSTDPNYVDNLIDALSLASLKEEAIGEAFNIGGGREVSIRELADMVVRAAGSKSKVKILPYRIGEKPIRSFPSIDKAQRILGYKPKVSLEEGLLKVVEYYRLLINQ